MRLAIVIGALERGGSEGQVVELVRQIHPGRAECVVICLQRPGPLAPAVVEAGARVVALGAQGPSAALTLLPRLARTLRRERPDVVYAFLFWSYTLALPVAAAVLPRACRIAARRALPALDVPRWRVLIPLRRMANRLSHGVMANSAAVRDAWTEAEPELDGRIWLVENGVHAAADPAPGSGGSSVTIICVANLIAYKGHDTLLEALARLPRGGQAWRVLLVGEGPERATIERACAERGLDDVVTLLGQQRDVSTLLQSADIAVLPSYGEGLPNAVLEALANGVPVVATAVGGVPRLLASGGGLTVPPRDPAALADALQAMIRDRDLRRRAGTEGWRLARSEFGFERMRDETLAAIDDICRRRAGR